MRKIFIGLLALTVSGCSISPETVRSYQENNKFDSIKHKTESGNKLSVGDLRERYFRETGMKLPDQVTLSCSLDDACYYNIYAQAYDSLLQDYERKQQTKQYLQAKEQKIKNEQCDADIECSRKRKVSQLGGQLRQLYTYVVNTNPYLRSEFDMAFRTVCDNAANLQVAGVPRESVLNDIRDKPGIDPDTREQIVNAASICWEISHNGGNWKEALR
ncbi:hypothetical protein IM876_09425 [Serratia plymuthica]|uniref:hypothetical protein n=1 Tax=Serratia plymuthica TaxID=82996 RepID=UPI00192920FA|nr:hypothetical protein [Serratia plymuthica]MBL3522883.1 hypothetical protein [Serratia plymuthica]